MSIRRCIRIHGQALQDAGVDIASLKTPEDVQTALDSLAETRTQIEDHVAEQAEPLYQEGESEKLGQIQFPEEGGAIITLLENANLSTFLHESGHFFFESYRAFAKDSPAVAEDMGALLQFVGVKDLATWEGMTLEQRRDGHEKVAQAFEKYLFEGEAPSMETEGLFATFRSWLMQIYSALRMQAVELTPEVRQVFDRMLATQEAIDFRRATNASTPLFEDAGEASMTPQQHQEYLKQKARKT
jgi:hypothetical protein